MKMRVLINFNRRYLTFFLYLYFYNKAFPLKMLVFDHKFSFESSYGLQTPSWFGNTMNKLYDTDFRVQDNFIYIIIYLSSC